MLNVGRRTLARLKEKLEKETDTTSLEADFGKRNP
jgi:hypothetical protein